MALYGYWIIASVIFAFLELATPTLFFLHLAVGALITAVIAYFGASLTIQSTVFIVISLVSLLFIRPIFMKKKEQKTEFEEHYMDKTVEVLEDIGANGTSGVGKIKIYDEVWNAKSANNCLIKTGEFAKITKIDSLTMYVEKIGEEAKCSE